MATEGSEVPLGSCPKRPRLDPMDDSLPAARPIIGEAANVPATRDTPQSNIVIETQGSSTQSHTSTGDTVRSVSPIVQLHPTLCNSAEARPGTSSSDGETVTQDPATSTHLDVDLATDVRSTRVVSSNWPGTSSEMMSPTREEQNAGLGEGHTQEDSEIDSDLDLGLGDLNAEPISGPMGWLHHKMMTGVDPRTILARILPPDFSLPSDMSDLEMWGLIAEYFQAFQEPEKRKKLSSFNTLDDVVSLLRSRQNVIVLSGAGVSVSCGIPDFRSRDGIYARLAVDFPDLPDPQAMFDIHYFRKDPRPFFKFAKEIYPGQYEPSICHKFISLLEKNKKLLRNYSQNIDTLEQVAGITKVVQCHGSFATATCTNCGYKVDAEVIRADVFNQLVPKCPQCQPEPGVQAILKPDIVFFGEGLPSFFYDCLDEDKRKVDLLIVIGSSLKVRPVATIPYPSVVANSIPQILINREPLPHMTFDIELLGDGDIIINELCHRLGEGWSHICTSPEGLREVTDIPGPNHSSSVLPKPHHTSELPKTHHPSELPNTPQEGADTSLPGPSEVDVKNGEHCLQERGDNIKQTTPLGGVDYDVKLPKAPGEKMESGVEVEEQSSLPEGEKRITQDIGENGPIQTTTFGKNAMRKNPSSVSSTVRCEDGTEDRERLAGAAVCDSSCDSGSRTERVYQGGMVGINEFGSAPTPPDLRMCDEEHKSGNSDSRRREQSGCADVGSKLSGSSVHTLSGTRQSTSESSKVVITGSEAECRLDPQDGYSSAPGKSSAPGDKQSSADSSTSSQPKPQVNDLKSGDSNESDSGSPRHKSSGDLVASSLVAGSEDPAENASSSGKHSLKGRKPRPRRQSITEHMEASTFLFMPPNRYVFHGAEVYQADHSSDEEDLNKSGDNRSTEEMPSAMESEQQENGTPSQYSHRSSSSEGSMLSPDSSTEACGGVPQVTNDTSSSQELSTADL